MIPFDISRIDELEDERYNDPTENDDYSSYDEDAFGTQHEVNCQSCSGTGEGTASGTSCVWCGGKGYKIIKN